MSQKLGRRARRRKSAPPETPPGEWAALGASIWGVKSAHDLMVAVLIGLLLPLLSFFPYMLGVYDDTVDFFLVFAMLWVGGIVPLLLDDHPNRLYSTAVRTVCGALVVAGISIVFGASSDGVALAVAVGAVIGGVFAGASGRIPF